MTPAYTPAERRARETFLALLRALSFPGLLQPLPARGLEEALQAIGEALLDEGVGLYAPGPLLQRLRPTGVRPRPWREADYLLLPRLEGEHLAWLGELRRGSLLEPERSATLVVGARLGQGLSLVLEGPGVEGSRQVRLGGLPPAFFAERARLMEYPLGFEVFLTDGQRVLGLPRTVRAEVL
ncbi:MAG: phosphonate C-P lyase system protein PhnH [Meiothermus sp.]|uniref:phosphonate C-P lyase system protein PhnH n=1 Tax=Meiothermus sp. TaxID=1955249 RepID=UPI0025DF9946|nr:phosphonate C-P lyase system protein PhnH [Meiothermus sp.]MCS7193366.1 phosphonate C-P lyase system protein PhnH [Meiothermus sp.]